MVNMKILASREEWLTHRTGIGGSDASCILGMNPYRTNQELWREKTGRTIAPDISDKPYVRYGTEAEEHLRELFALDFPEYKVEYAENNMWINDKYPFAHASLDGWLTDPDGRKGILEIKTTNILQSMQREKWKDQIPDNYFCQVLHYLMVTEFDFVILKAQLKYEYGGELPRFETKHYLIERADVGEDLRMLEEEERAFWERVKANREPALVLPLI